jgi:adenylate cyclase
VRNIAELETAAAGRGMIVPGVESDGIVRRVPAVIEVAGDLYPTLTVELLRVATGQSTYAIRSQAAGISSIVVNRVKIPTDQNGRFWVHFSHSEPKRFVSAKDVIAGTLPEGRLKGKLVLVGTSASGLHDLRSTPLGVMPGVEIHAQLLENILQTSYLLRPADSMGIELAITLVAGLLIIVLLPLIGARWAALLFVVVVLGAGATSWYLFTDQGIMIDVTYAAIVTFLIYSLLTYTSYARAEAQRQEVRTAFSRYLSPTLVEQLADDPSRLQLGGEDRYMTLLFADVEHFTAISEQYDARSLTRLVNRFFTPMTDAILNWKGTVDKYMGDCIMAFWNAPLDDPQHAHNACLAALEMQERLIPLNQELRAEAEAEDRTYLPIHVGIGLNSGDCMVGNMGSDQRFDYSVLGDTVNVASRLEGQSRAYRVGIILGESVVQLVPELATLELDLVRVVGKSVPERIYTIVGDEAVATSEDFQTLKSSHEEMLAAYRAQDWSAAQDALMRCEELDARFGLHGYYEMFERRIGAFEARSPGADWDGVFVAETK